MAKARTITFDIVGHDNLTAALKAAANNIKSLADLNKSINAKALAQANRLQQAQAQLQNLNAYRKLQQAQAQAQKAYLGLGQDMEKIFARRKAEAAQLESMRQAYSRLQQAYKDNKRTMSAAQLASQQAQLTQARASLPAGTLAAHEMQLCAQIQQTTNALNAEIAAIERRNQIANNFSNANQNLANAYSNFQSAVDSAQVVQPLADASYQAATSLTNVQMPADAASQSLTQLPPSIDAVNASAQSVPPQEFLPFKLTSHRLITCRCPSPLPLMLKAFYIIAVLS